MTTSSRQKTGRPDNISRAERPDRVPVSGNRDILTVQGKDDSYHYRWVLDQNESGQRIFKFLRAGYEFVTKDQGIKVGESLVYKSDNNGSIIRSPGGNGQFLYLMRIPREWYEEDQRAKQNLVRENEKSINKASTDDGQYGDVKLSSGTS